MTVSVIKYVGRDIPDFAGIRCYADSLISSISTNSELTVHAMKILPLQIKSQLWLPENQQIQPMSIGFTFAGNLDVALLTYNLLAFCCSCIQRNPVPEGRLPPAIKDIADLCAQILRNYNLSYGVINSEHANAEILLFGYCPQDAQYKAFHVYPHVVGSSFKVVVKDVDICNIDYYAIGSGKERLKQKVDSNGAFSYKLVKELIAENEGGVGGFYQRAWASVGDVRLFAEPRTVNNCPTFSFCGFNTVFPCGKFHIVGFPMHISED